jgi:hypothetical protein
MTHQYELDSAGDLAATIAGDLRISGGAANVNITDASLSGQLYRARFRGLIPTVADENGTVAVRYRGRLHPFVADRGDGIIELSTRVPWNVHVHDAAAGMTLNLSALTLTGFAFDGPVADISFDLPQPVGEVTIRISGPARNLRLRRPSGVPVGIRIGGGATHVHIDGEELGAVGRGYHNGVPSDPDRYTLVIAKAADGLVVTH